MAETLDNQPRVAELIEKFGVNGVKFHNKHVQELAERDDDVCYTEYGFNRMVYSQYSTYSRYIC